MVVRKTKAISISMPAGVGDLMTAEEGVCKSGLVRLMVSSCYEGTGMITVAGLLYSFPK